MIIGMGIFYGGLAQIIAGVLEYKKGNTFATTAFTSYGLFWLSFVTLNLLEATSTKWHVDQEALAAYFFMWGIFTLAMFFGTLKVTKTLQFVFMSLAILFFLLTAKSADLELFTSIIGVEGVICGLSAVYLALAEVLNEVHGRTVLPT